MKIEELSEEEIKLLEKSDGIEKSTNEESKKSLKNIIYKVNRLEETLNNSVDVQEKLKIIYEVGKTLLASCSDNVYSQRLPVAALKTFSKHFVGLIVKNSFTLSNFKALIPNTYDIGSHSVNVAIFASLIGSKEGMNAKELNNLFLAGLLHDIGESKIDKRIINKQGKITKEERKILKKHPLESVKHLVKHSINNQELLSGVIQHHERLDGTGYPEGLKGYSISTWGQILGISDVFDALITQKSYRDAYSTFDALILMKKDMGKQFNLKYVNTLIKLLR